MERINLAKNTLIKEILLSGLAGQEFTCAKVTACPSTPTHLFYNRELKTIALFRTGIRSDELILEQFTNPDKLKILSGELRSYNDRYKNEIADILDEIADGSFFEEACDVTYL